MSTSLAGPCPGAIPSPCPGASPSPCPCCASRISSSALTALAERLVMVVQGGGIRNDRMLGEGRVERVERVYIVSVRCVLEREGTYCVRAREGVIWW